MTYLEHKENLINRYNQVVPNYYRNSAPPQGYTSEEIQQVEQQMKVIFPDSLRFALQLIRGKLHYCFPRDANRVHVTLEEYPQNKAMMLEDMKRVNYTCPFDLDQIIVFTILKQGMPDGSYPYVYYFINANDGENPPIYTFSSYLIDDTSGPTILLDELWNGPYHMKVLAAIDQILDEMEWNGKD